MERFSSYTEVKMFALLLMNARLEDKLDLLPEGFSYPFYFISERTGQSQGCPAMSTGLGLLSCARRVNQKSPPLRILRADCSEWAEPEV